MNIKQYKIDTSSKNSTTTFIDADKKNVNVYIRLRDGIVDVKNSKKLVPIKQGVVVIADYNKKGNILGIEVIGAKKVEVSSEY